MKEKITNAAIIVLTAVAVASFVRISSLETDIQMLRHDRQNDLHSLQQRISNIHNDVDEQMKKEASLFSGVEHVLGALDAENRKAMLGISVVPKTEIDGMKVTLSVGEQTAEMKKKNGKYTAIVPVGMFEEYDTAPLATIRTGNETKNEYLETVPVSYLWSNYLPAIENAEIWNEDVTLREAGDKSTVMVNGYMEMSYCLSKLSPEVVFEKLYVLAETEKGEIARKAITAGAAKNHNDGAVGSKEVLKEIVAERTNQTEASVALSSPFREIYEIGESEELKLYIVAEDSLGYVHKVCAFKWQRPDENGNAREPKRVPELAGVYNRGEEIYDKDGTLLFGKE